MNLLVDVFMWSLLATPLGAPNAIDLEREVLAARMELRSGIVEFAGKTSGGRETIYKVTFDGTNIRSDVVQSLLVHSLDGENEGNATSSRDLHKYVFANGEVLYHTDVQSASGRGVAAYKCEVGTQEGRGRAQAYMPYKLDPRKVGIIPTMHQVLHVYGLEDILTFPNRRRSEIARESIDGRDVWKVEYEKADGTEVAIWIDPSRGPCVVKASIAGTSRMGRLVTDTIENEMEQYGAEGIWFPRKVHHQRTIEGRIVIESVLEVKRAEFNLEVDPVVFTLKGMDIPIGTLVREQSKNAQAATRYWNGEELQGRQVVAADHTSSGAAPLRGYGWWIVAANLFGLVLVFGYLYARKGLVSSANEN